MAKKVFYVSILHRDFVRREEDMENRTALWTHIYKYECCWDSNEYGDVLEMGDLVVLTEEEYLARQPKTAK